MINQFRKVTIPVGGSLSETTGANVLTIVLCSLPILAAFDGGPGNPCAVGSVFAEKFNFCTFTNTNTLAVTLSYWVGDAQVAFQPADNSISNAQTFAFGDLGIPISTAAGVAFTGSPANDALGYLQVTNNMNLAVPSVGIYGKSAGHRRQTITFTVQTSSPAPLNISDDSGLVFMTIPAGSIVQLVTDAPLLLSGAGGLATVSIGQIFLTNS